MDEENSSYSIYVDQRPHRTLHVFNSSKLTFEHIDKIMEYNLRKWGGRYNFILPTKRSEISTEQWKFLRRYDPDFVKLNIPISKKLALEFDRKITPLQVVDGNARGQYSPRNENEGISILPTVSNIRQVSNAFGSNVFIVLFDIDDCEDEDIRKFITRNFGTLNLREVGNLPLNQYENKLQLKITDKQSFKEAICLFNDFKPYVFPIQLCSIGDYIDDDRKIDNENRFYIFVGDNPLELIDFWNNPFYLQSWTRKRLRQLWMPTSIAEDKALADSLKNLIKGRADPYGNGQKEVLFSSRSLAKNRLTEIANRLTSGLYIRKNIQNKISETYPNYSDYFSFDRIKSDMIHIRASGKEEKIIVSTPNIKEGAMGGEYWMNDLYVQIPERKVVPVNFETWLQLPRNNSVAHTIVKSAPSRITRDGIPSMMASRSSRFNSNSQELTLTLPKTWNTFASMILNTGKPVFTNDVRSKYIKPYVYEIEVSGAGRHIYGFLEVFNDLENAYQIFEERLWRMSFELMANIEQKKEDKRLSDIKTSLNKKIQTMVSDPNNLSSGAFLDWLSRLIQKTAKVYLDAQPQAISFKDLDSLAKEELSKYNSKHPKNKFKYSKRNLVKALKRLTDGAIILIGYELRCPSCLNKDWRPLNEIDQFITCRGCGFEYTFPPEMEIKYKLNSLIENGVRSRGVVPVVLALGTLFRDARHYFDFLPPVDIYKKRKLLTDLDICCVVDGEFIVGEVKAQHGLFHPSDFEKITKLAREIHPDRVVFSSMDQQPSQRVKKLVQQASDDLKDEDIKVEWLYLDSRVFEAQPIY